MSGAIWRNDHFLIQTRGMGPKGKYFDDICGKVPNLLVAWKGPGCSNGGWPISRRQGICIPTGCIIGGGHEMAHFPRLAMQPSLRDLRRTCPNEILPGVAQSMDPKQRLSYVLANRLPISIMQLLQHDTPHQCERNTTIHPLEYFFELGMRSIDQHCTSWIFRLCQNVKCSFLDGLWCLL